MTVRDVNDNPPKFDSEEHIGIPDNAVEGDTVTYIRVRNVLLYAFLLCAIHPVYVYFHVSDLRNQCIFGTQASDPDAGDNATIAFGLVQSSAYFKIASDTGAVVLIAPSITLSQYDLTVEAVDKNGHSTGKRASKHFKVDFS